MRCPSFGVAGLAPILFVVSSSLPAQQFTSSVLVGGYSLIEKMVTADLNGDGSIELILAGRNTSFINGWVDVFSRMPDGSWASFWHVNTGSVDGLLAVDVTGDDRPELLVSHQMYPPGPWNTIWLDTYSFPPSLQGTQLSSQPGVTGRYWLRGDGDDLPDLVGAGSFARNLGNGVFAPPVGTPLPYPALAREVGDFNGDGIADVVLLLPSPLRLDVWCGDGLGAWVSTASTQFPGSTGLGVFLVGDINRDGALDLVIDRTIALGSGTGTFTFVPLPAAVWPLAIGDFDGNGLPDLLSQDQLGGIVIYRQQSGMTFVTNGTVAGGASNNVVVVLDANQDGHLDYAALRATHTTGPFVGEIFTSVRPHAIPAVWPYGVGTWGCRGHVGLSVNADPTLGLASFGIIAANLPPRAPGVLLAYPGALWQPAPTQPFGLGFTLHIPWSAAIALPFLADIHGQAHLAAPLPPTPLYLHLQGLWLAPNGDGDCSASPIGVITSNAIRVLSH